jgi:glycosyltransferase involved in cell wall biosynthesis
VCTLREPGPRAEALGSAVDLIALNATGRNPLHFLKLARVIQRTGADVVHARNWGTWTDTVLATKVARTARPLLGFHGLLEGGRFSKSQRRRARILGMDRLPAATVSFAARDLLVDDLGASPDRIEVIPNGVDTEHFAPARADRHAKARERFGLAPDDVVVGSTGAFKPVKDHATLLSAFAELANAQSRVKLLLAGRGPIEEAVRAKARQLGLDDRVIFAGWLEDIRDVLAAMDIYVSSSLSEGMSSAVLEAMSAGLACVATDVSDHRLILGPVAAELVTPPGDVPAMRQALTRLASDKAWRLRVGDQCRLIIVDHFSFDKTCHAYQRMYDSLLADGIHPATRPEAPAAELEPAAVGT